MTADVRAWIPFGPRNADGRQPYLPALLSRDEEGKWLAKTLERRLVTKLSVQTAHHACSDLRLRLDEQVKADIEAGIEPLSTLRRASTSSWQRFEQTPHSLSMSTRVVVMGQPWDVLVFQKSYGWTAMTLPHMVLGQPSATQSEAFTSLQRELQEVLRLSTREAVLKYEPASEAFMSMLNSPGHENFDLFPEAIQAA